MSFFNWKWKNFDFNLFGGGFYFGINDDKAVKFHIAEVVYKPFKSLSVNLSAGPFLGDLINLYDNIQDTYTSYGSIGINYLKYMSFFKLKLGFNLLYSTKNSKKSYFNIDDDSMEDGFMYELSFSLGGNL